MLSAQPGHLRHSWTPSIRPNPGTAALHRAHFQPLKRLSVLSRAAASGGTADEVELSIKIATQAMTTAAQENRFEDAAKHRDHLDELQLKQRLMLLEQHEQRRRKIRHKLGEIIEHKKYKYRGVIFGMHATCEAPEQWIKMMGVDKLEEGRDQPFYNVLVDMRDRPNQTTYVAQENISKPAVIEDLEDPIQHANKHVLFLGFKREEMRYIPREHLRIQYPDSEPLQESTDEQQPL